MSVSKAEPSIERSTSKVLHLGKLLALPTNVRLEWKGLPGTNTIALLQTLVNKRCQDLYDTGPKEPM
jgi:hypothetical protein